MLGGAPLEVWILGAAVRSDGMNHVRLGTFALP